MRRNRSVKIVATLGPASSGVETWRSVLPTVIASALAVAALGLAGLPFQLFAVLGLFIVLGAVALGAVLRRAG